MSSLQLSGIEETVFERLEEARQFRQPLLGHHSGGLSVAAAYRVQRAMIGGQKVRGYKLERFGQDWMYGPVHPQMIQSNAVKLEKFMQPYLEPEIALILRDALLPGATRSDVKAALWGYLLAVDFRDSAWQDHQASLAEHIADGANAGGFVLSSERLTLAPTGVLRLCLDGQELTQGNTSELGDPIERVQWLLEQVGRIESGAMVFLGSPAVSVPAQKGKLELIADVGVLEVKLM